MSLSSGFARLSRRAMQEKKKVGILGASGAVGSRFAYMLNDHPWFELVALGGGPDEVGRAYGEVAYTNYNFLDNRGVPSNLAGMKIISGDDPASWKKDLGVDLVFSACPDEVALTAEKAFAMAGLPVFSNSPVNRMDPNTPLLQPYINPGHLELAKTQAAFANKGFVATNPNCSTIALTIGLKPVFEKFGIEAVVATTLQSTSGSGYPGLPFADMWDNCVPYIGNEEDKIEEEGAKILGSFNGSGIDHAECRVTATANRVPTSDGHMICVSMKLKNKATPEEVKAAIRDFVPHPDVAGLPSCPKKPIRLFDDDEPKRPQHRLDRMYEGGMGVSVGRVRGCKVNDIKYTILGHNTIIGAAGGSILNAELAIKTGMV